MGSREENEAVAGLLRRSLACDAHAESACLESELLAAYFEHSLPADEAKTCDVHLSGCAHCREQLAAMARAEQSPEIEVRETQPQRAWRFDWRWLTAAAAVMVLVTVWLVRKPQKLAGPNQSENALVAENKVAPPKPSSAIAEYDSNKLSSKSGSRKEAPLNRIQAPAQSASLASKKIAPSAQKADDFAAGARSRPATEPESQLADSSVAARESSRAAIEARDSKQSSRARQQARLASAGHNFAAQQSQSTQSVTAEAEARQLSSASPQQSRAQAAAGPGSFQTGAGTGAGSGAGGAQVQAQAQSAPPPSAAAADSLEGAGRVAGAKASLDAERAARTKQGMPSEANAGLRKDRGAALEVLEKGSSEKVINTPVPGVKWRIGGPGFVERTEDGGATWKGQELETTEKLLDGSAPDEKVCWVAGRNGIIFVTQDGTTWQKIRPPASADIVAVSAEDASSATVTTAEGRRFSTHNRGKKWKLEQDSSPR